MVQSQRISNFGLVVLALVLFMINSAEPKPRSGPKIRRLVEIKTVDENGVVKERVVAEYEPTEGHKTSSESAGGEKRYQDDDEDSRELSSGDSETYSESYDMVANDDPMSPSNQSSSESSGLLSRSSSSNSTTTKPVDSKSSTVLPTSGRINASTPSPSTARDIISKTTNIDTTTAVPRTTNPATTTGIKVTVTTGKSQNATTLSTLSPSTKETRNNLTTLPPKVTEIEATTLATTTMATTSASTTTASAPMVNSSAPTTTTTVTTTTLTPKPTETSTTASPNSTNHGNNNTNQTVIPITEASVTKGSPGVKAVEGQDGPETKASRKTLFGFVTVEILIALLAGALFSVLLVAFLVYRLKKRNEGSYELSETIALRPKEIDEMGKKKEVFV